MDNKLDLTSRLSDQMKAVIEKQQELCSNAFATDVSREVMRENYVRERAFWNEGGPVMARTEESELTGPLGAFKVRRYYPKTAPENALIPAIVYIHGGGFIVGNCDTHDRICRMLADQTGAAVVSVDYHLSPESTYPTNIQESVVVLSHVHKHGSAWGIDGNDISIAGDSGGAVLALASALWLRDEEGDNSFISTLLLYYGFYGLRDSLSRRLYGSAVDGMTEADLAYYNECWLGSTDESYARLPYIDLLHNDLTTSMPACYIASADLDPLRDDSACLAEILKDRGIPCEYENFEGVLHAFAHHSRMLDDAFDLICHSATFWSNHHAR